MADVADNRNGKNVHIKILIKIRAVIFMDFWKNHEELIKKFLFFYDYLLLKRLFIFIILKWMFNEVGIYYGFQKKIIKNLKFNIKQEINRFLSEINKLFNQRTMVYLSINKNVCFTHPKINHNKIGTNKITNNSITINFIFN